ncbi:MAG: nucleotidyltransferase domain-containing protein [bacterium]
MDKIQVRHLVEEYAQVVAREFPESEVFLFGSYVNGNPNEDSDIDVAVVFPEIVGDFLTLAARLHHLRNDIDPIIEPHLLSRMHDESGFLAEIQRTGEVFYRAA